MKYSFFGPQGGAAWVGVVQSTSGHYFVTSHWFLTLPVRQAFRANSQVIAEALVSQRDHVVIEGTTYEIARRKLKEVG